MILKMMAFSWVAENENDSKKTKRDNDGSVETMPVKCDPNSCEYFTLEI